MEPNYSSQHQLALVTGAAHRLGKALAMCLASQGYAVAVHYNDSEADALDTVESIRTLGVPAYPIHADLTRLASIVELFDKIDAICAEKDSPITRFSVLVNSAARMPRADVRTMPAADFDDTLALNLRAPFLLSQRAYQRMAAGGLIVNISDVGAGKVWNSFPAYTISKAGLEALTKVLARSFAPSVRVNAIAPGLVLPTEGMAAEDWDRLVVKVPAGRPAQVDEITVALQFLIQNEYITGQTLTIDGGYSLI